MAKATAATRNHWGHREKEDRIKFMAGSRASIRHPPWRRKTAPHPGASPVHPEVVGHQSPSVGGQHRCTLRDGETGSGSGQTVGGQQPQASAASAKEASGRSGPPDVPAGSSLTGRTRSRTIDPLPPSVAAATGDRSRSGPPAEAGSSRSRQSARPQERKPRVDRERPNRQRLNPAGSRPPTPRGHRCLLDFPFAEQNHYRGSAGFASSTRRTFSANACMVYGFPM